MIYTTGGLISLKLHTEEQEGQQTHRPAGPLRSLLIFWSMWESICSWLQRVEKEGKGGGG